MVLLDDIMTIDKVAFREKKALDFHDPRQKRLDCVEGQMWNFFSETAIAQGYNFREGQYDMAEGVLEAIRGRHHLAVEAGVGIGKSFAYLVPLVLYHVQMHAPILIATSTIALQEQLASDLTKLLEMLDFDEEIVVAKGQANYVCLRKALRYIDHWGRKKEARLIEKALDDDLYDRKDFPAEIDDTIWGKIRIQDYRKKDCSLCPHAENCYYHQMRLGLPEAGIVISNQDLLIAHFKVSEAYNVPLLNPKAEVLVIDEAHNLENKIRFSHTGRISSNSIMSKAEAAELTLVKGNDDTRSYAYLNLRNLADRLFNNIRAQAIKQSKLEIFNLSESMRASGTSYSEKELFDMLESDKFFFNDEDGAYELLDQMIEAADIFTEYLLKKARYIATSEQLQEMQSLTDSLKKFRDNRDDYVIWTERMKKGWDLCYCPKDIGEICSGYIFRGKRTTILTSATMTGGNADTNTEKYAYWADGVGYPEAGEEVTRSERELAWVLGAPYGEYMTPIPSPFDYDRHAMIYYTNDMPHPTKDHEAFLTAGIKRLKEILDISEGRALVLFTSKADMRRTADELRRMEVPYNILVQTAGSSQEDIIRVFRKDEHAVLMGTGAFWEGISVEGVTLSNVVIFRLPFSVPDPIIAEKELQKKDPLMEVRVPEMIIKLKQGVGRLIRNEEDRGIISIIDSRMGDKSRAPYKDKVWDALPIKNRTSDLDVIRKFYRETVIEVIETTGQGVNEASEDRDDEGNHSTEGYDGMEEDRDVEEDCDVGEDSGVEGHLDGGGDE